MTVTIIIAGKNNIACNVLKYLITKEKGTHNKTKILALPNENDDGIDNWQYSFKKTALEPAVPCRVPGSAVRRYCGEPRSPGDPKTPGG